MSRGQVSDINNGRGRMEKGRWTLCDDNVPGRRDELPFSSGYRRSCTPAKINFHERVTYVSRAGNSKSIPFLFL